MAADQASLLAARAPVRPDIEVIDDQGPAPGRARRARPLLWPLACYLAARAVVTLASIPAMRESHPGAGPWPDIPGGNAFTRVLAQWDGAWYLWVANRGYPGPAQYRQHLSDVAFFPLFPACIRGLSAVTGLSTLTSALVLSFVFGALATVLVWMLCVRLVGRDKANRAIALFVFFPGAFVLSMAYAETLMIAAIAASLLFLLERRWWLAGVAAALATATRPNAIAILLACAVVAFVELRERRDWSVLTAPVLAASGVGAFFVFLWVHTGHMTAWFQSERLMWHDHFAFGVPIAKHFVGMFTSLPLSLASGRLNDLIATVGLVVAVVALVLLWRARWPLAVKAYTAIALLIPFGSNAVGHRPRMLFAAFPMAALAADRLSRRWYAIMLAVSIALLVGMTYITTTSLAAVP